MLQYSAAAQASGNLLLNCSLRRNDTTTKSKLFCFNICLLCLTAHILRDQELRVETTVILLPGSLCIGWRTMNCDGSGSNGQGLDVAWSILL